MYDCLLISSNISCYSRPDVDNCTEAILAGVQSRSLQVDFSVKIQFHVLQI